MSPTYLATKSGVIRAQLFAHSRIRQNQAFDFHLLTGLDDEAALRKKWRGSETDVGEQLLEATAGGRLVDVLHQRPGHTAMRIRASDEK